MGQQQLLLLVLGMVIVGIAVVAGIQAFSEGKEKAARDAAVSDAMRIVSDIQAWKMKPAAFGGGASVSTLPNFKQLGYPSAGIDPSNDSKYQTVSGCYEITTYGGTENDGDEIATVNIGLKDASGGCTDPVVFAKVHIGGTTVDNIEWEYTS